VPTQDETLLTREGPVVTLTFNRPEARNAMTWGMYDRLYQVCEEVDADDSVRVLVLRGAGGKAFVAGTDISQFKVFERAEDGIAYERDGDKRIARLEAVRKPVIAQVQGFAVGGGFRIATACDLRVATPDARFGAPIARTLGNCLSASNIGRLSALIGATRLKEIIFTARLIEAEEAVGIGLLHEVVEDIPALERRADELARLVAGHAPLTLRATKQALHRMQPKGCEDEDLILMCYQSQDFHEGMDAFLNKRQPQWTGS